MKVILSRDVPKLGKEGQLVEVEGGYGRNYLIPRGLAVTADKGNLKMWEERQKMLQHRADRIKQHARTASQQIDSQQVTIAGRTAPNSTKLFGAITAGDIADAIREQHGVKVDKRRIDLIDPIRYTGTYTVDVQWDSETRAAITVEVQGAEA
jgi:large subunit ribosomal protein L9